MDELNLTGLFDGPKLMSDMNEEGVPLDEYEAGGIWHEYLTHHDVYMVRVENIGLSMPDCILTYKGLIWFNEMKIRRGNYIYMPIYQMPCYRRLAKNLRRWQMAYVVFDTGHFDIYDFQTISSAKLESTNSGKVRIDISELPILMTIHDVYETDKYIQYITDKAFKKKT